MVNESISFFFFFPFFLLIRDIQTSLLVNVGINFGIEGYDFNNLSASMFTIFICHISRFNSLQKEETNQRYSLKCHCSEPANLPFSPHWIHIIFSPSSATSFHTLMLMESFYEDFLYL